MLCNEGGEGGHKFLNTALDVLSPLMQIASETVLKDLNFLMVIPPDNASYSLLPKLKNPS